MRFNSTNNSNLEQNNNKKHNCSPEEHLGPENLTPLPIYLKQGIIGILLGDGTLVKKYKGGGTYFQYAQGEIHHSYLLFVFNLFSKAGLCNMVEPSKGSSFNKSTGLTYNDSSLPELLLFITKSVVEFNYLNSMFYSKLNPNSNRIKIIPTNMLDLLSPIGLAFWLMDDGNKTSKGIQLNSNAFSDQDLNLLLEVLRVKFELKCSLHSRNRIYIWSSSIPRFVELIKPHIEDSMKYKIEF